MFLLDNSSPEVIYPVWNGLFLGGMLISIAGLFTAYIFYKNSSGLRRWEKHYAKVLLVWGVVWWLYTGLHEIAEFKQGSFGSNLMLVFIALSCLAFYGLRRRQAWTHMPTRHCF